MKRIFFTKFLLGLMALATPVMAQANELTISAAASLNNAFTELKDEFLKENKGVTIYTNFAASNNLLKQMEQGAPVDIFASADQETMDKAQAGSLITPESRKNFVENALVLITPKSNNTVKSLADLEKANKIAIGAVATVPAGRYAKTYLEEKNLWSKLQSKLIFGEHVRQVLEYVSKDEVDAGFVYKTDAFVAQDKLNIIANADSSDKIIYPIAITKNTQNKELAQKFIDFVLSDKGQAILAKYGFQRP